MLTLNDGRSELWQWDTGRTLSVPDDCSQVHFSNKVFGRSIDVDVVDGVAVIPDILLQTDKELTAWAFVGTAENGYTKISKVFKVNKRNKPADYVFTPTEQTTLGEILDRIEDLENRHSGDVSEEDIQNAVNDYLDKNPVSFEEKDPTVPAWAKKPNKPTYTAAEVGALPVDTVIPEGGIPIPPTASVGQTIVVKAVDDSGKPTEWEAADMPSGDSSNGYTLLNSLTLREEARVVEFTSDLSGNPFAAEDLLILLRTTPMEGASEKCGVNFAFVTGTKGAAASLTNAVWTGTTKITCSATFIKPYNSTMFRMSCIRNGESQPATAFGTYNASLTADSYVDKIQVFIPPSQNHNFGVGTTVEVYGR